MKEFEIFKGINRSVEFMGFKAQYINYFLFVLVGSMILFAALYFVLNIYIATIVSIGGLIGGFLYLKFVSSTYGEYGLTRKIARSRQIKGVFNKRSEVFYQLKEKKHV